MDGPKQFIERLRREKFSVGAERISPLAPELHQAIQQLSVELYQNDVHFVKEIIQNAEDNSYGADVRPSLEFQLVKQDVAHVGASATLLVLNNERGLTAADVTALCSVGRSTKVGRRNEGYIGCKGIGFKSVFMICETPLIFSNGYRIGFRDAASREAGVGYIVPEWKDSPTDDALLSACGRDELPATLIVLPIRDGKVDLVRKQLKELSPEIILFLKRIRELNVVEKTGAAVEDLLRITRTEPVSGIRTNNECKFFEVTLQVDNIVTKGSDAHSYLIFQRLFPVTHPVEERSEVSEWAVTLAFPKEGRAPSGHIGDVFSFLPTELKTGFPFIINADFILTSSRETIRFDSKWNIGILGCIPSAFRVAFQIMLRKQKRLWARGITLNSKVFLNSKDAYKFVPKNNVENAYRYSSAGSTEYRQVRQKTHIQPHLAANVSELEEVRAKILKMLEKERVILVSRSEIGVFEGNDRNFMRPEDCLQIRPSFRRILEIAARSKCAAPSVLLNNVKFDGVKYNVVDGYVQENYSAGLLALGVCEMSPAQYESFIKDSEWLLRLPEELYVQVLSFTAFEINLRKLVGEFSFCHSFHLLKVRKGRGEVEMTTFYDFSSRWKSGSPSELFYTPAQDAEWICKWLKKFKGMLPAKVMPAATSQALLEARDSYMLKTWIQKHGSLSELTVQKYSEKLIQKLAVCTSQQYETLALKSKSGSPFPVLVIQFLYSAIRKKLLQWDNVVNSIQNLRQLTVIEHMGSKDRGASSKMRADGHILLPPKVSEWPQLFSLSPGYASHLIVLSDMYLDSQSSLVKGYVSSSPGPESMQEFLKQAFNAVDLPLLDLPHDAPLPFLQPVTMEKSVLILKWLKVFLPNRRTTKMEQEKDSLLQSLKTTKWMKTLRHGWQCPVSVFFTTTYDEHFTAEDLHCLDEPAYSPLDLKDSESQFVFAELGVVTDMEKGCAVAVEHFSQRPAMELDLAAVTRFYTYFYKSGWSDENHSVRVWIPAIGTSKVPQWKAPSECLVRDKDKIFSDNNEIIVLDKYYDETLLFSMSEMLQLPEKAPVEVYCKVWLEWCGEENVVEENSDHPQRTFWIGNGKVQGVWKHVSQNFHKCNREVWDSFLSRAWVPVDPSFTDSKSESIKLLPRSQVFLVNDSVLAKSFSEILRESLNFAWVLPRLSSRQLEQLIRLYSLMGVKLFSEMVTCDLQIPLNVGTNQIPYGWGLICEGLFRTVLAYMCQHGVKYCLSATDRQKIVSPLISATEIVVNEPFPKRHSLHLATLPAPTSVTKNVFSYFCKSTGVMYYLNSNHVLLQGDIGKRVFNAHFAAVVSIGILSDYPELVQGLTTLLKLLCDSRFAMKSVEYELQVQNLILFPEDEKLLAESIATRH